MIGAIVRGTGCGNYDRHRAMDSAVRFSTKHLPGNDGISLWREFFIRRFGPVEVEVRSGAPFDAEVTLLSWPGLRAMWCRTSAQIRFSRTNGMIGDDHNMFAFIVNQGGGQGGELAVSQLGAGVSLRDGEAVAILCDQPGNMMVAQVEFACLIASRAMLSRLVGEVGQVAMRRVRRDNEPLRHIIRNLVSLREVSEFHSPEVRHLVVTHIHDLIGMALGAKGHDGRGIRAARLSALKSDILENFGNPELTVRSVAEREHVTPRYVHMLFETEGHTFSEFVLGERLMHAHHMLSDPRFAQRSISAIAFESGFGDLSYFDRTFRRRFGATPSNVRQSRRVE